MTNSIMIHIHIVSQKVGEVKQLQTCHYDEQNNTFNYIYSYSYMYCSVKHNNKFVISLLVIILFSIFSYIQMQDLA